MKKNIFILAFILCSVFYLISLTIPDKFEATAVVKPSTSSSTNILSQLRSFSPFSALVTPEASSQDNSVLALELIKSKTFLEQLIIKRDILPDLMAPKKWHNKNQFLEYDLNLYDPEKRIWVRDVSFPKQKIPSTQEAHEKFLDSISIDTTRGSPFIKISVTHISPVVAKNWVDWIIQDVNDLISQLRISEAETSIEFINEEILKTPYAELKSLFYEMIQEHTSTMILAKVVPEFAITTVDKALIPENTSEPNRALLTISLVTLSFFLSLLFYVILILFKLK